MLKKTSQVLTLKNCIEPPSYASFVKIWATYKNFLGKWFTAPLGKNCPYAYGIWIRKDYFHHLGAKDGKMKCVSVKWSLNCSVYLLYKILCSSSCQVKCAYARFPLSKQSRHLRCDCHSRSWRTGPEIAPKKCAECAKLKSSNCFLHLALPALFYLGQRSHLMPGNDARVRYSLGANVNTPYFQYPR